MTQLIDQGPLQAPAADDLASAIQEVMRASAEPLTISKVRAALPARHRTSPEELAEFLRRQAAANVLIQYPRYRSQQDRFWDRPMDVHVAALIEVALAEGPLPSSALRRKLPAYAHGHAENVLDESVRKGRVHRHPRTGRNKERYGLQAARPHDYLLDELQEVFDRLGLLGFEQSEIRAAAIELLHEKEWESRPARAKRSEPSESGHGTSPGASTEAPSSADNAARAAETHSAAHHGHEHHSHCH